VVVPIAQCNEKRRGVLDKYSREYTQKTVEDTKKAMDLASFEDKRKPAAQTGGGDYIRAGWFGYS